MIIERSDKLTKHLRKKTAVALGSFDAIHKGHIAIISEAVALAKQKGMLSLVQLFEVPPAVIDGAGAINTLEKRIEIIRDLGADAVVIETFDEAFKNIEYTDFVLDYLKNRYNCGAVVAGENYRFGHFAKGDSNELARLCKAEGIDAKILGCLELDGVISSTRIRDCIKRGCVDKAAVLMTRPYSVSGEVVRGNSLGKSIDFPTANIEIPQGLAVPLDGVYSTQTVLDGKRFDSITNIGTKPTVGCGEKNIETHIAGFDGDLYGKRIEVEFLKRIRDIKKFENLEQLKLQLQDDIKQI